MDKKINNFDFDFMPIGQAIKKAREAKKVTREQLAEIVDYSARHIQSVENEGQHPSFELFIQLITMFDVSVDEYIFPNKKTNKSSVRRRLETLLDNLDDGLLILLDEPDKPPDMSRGRFCLLQLLLNFRHLALKTVLFSRVFLHQGLVLLFGQQT